MVIGFLLPLTMEVVRHQVDCIKVLGHLCNLVTIINDGLGRGHCSCDLQSMRFECCGQLSAQLCEA